MSMYVNFRFFLDTLLGRDQSIAGGCAHRDVQATFLRARLGREWLLVPPLDPYVLHAYRISMQYVDIYHGIYSPWQLYSTGCL